MRSSIVSAQAVPSRQGVHWPQLSWAKNRQLLCRKSTIDTVSSSTTTAAVPRPRQPTLPGPVKSSGVSNSASVSRPMLMPPGIAALAFAALPHAAAVLVDQLAAGDAQRRFVAAGLVDVAAEAIQLRAVAAGIARVLGIGRHADRS